MKLTQRTVDAIHMVTIAGCFLIIGLTLYNWSRSGRLDYSSFGVVILIFTLVALQRAARKSRSDRTE